MKTSIRDRVKKGAALLDAKIPGWEKKQDLGILNLKSGCDCVLGQADNGDYWGGQYKSFFRMLMDWSLHYFNLSTDLILSMFLVDLTYQRKKRGTILLLPQSGKDLFKKGDLCMFEDQIKAGAKLLDENFGPAWVKKQDLEKFDIGNACLCVIGQTYDTENNFQYRNVLGILFPDQDRIQASRAHGFSVDLDEDIPTLTNEWKAYITERRKSNELKPSDLPLSDK